MKLPKRECNRALCIEEPVDPKLHDIPLGSSSGEDYSASYWLLNGNGPSRKKDDQENLLSVKVETMMDYYRGSNQPAADTINDAVIQFKRHNSWILWICPFSDSDCDGYWASNPQELIQHFLLMHFQGFSKNLKSVMDQKLKFHEKTYCDGSSPFGGVSFCQDLDQHDLFHFRDLGNMLQSVLLSSKAEPSSVQEMRTKKCREAAVILKSLEKELKTFPKLKSGAKVQKAFDSLQKLWVELLEASNLDCEVILPLISSFKWEEIKECFETDNEISSRSYRIDVSDAVFLDCLGISVENNSEPSHVNMDRQNGGERAHGLEARGFDEPVQQPISGSTVGAGTHSNHPHSADSENLSPL
ncbi:hypothetical protein C2845_PM01G00430 [Panicum miliaceum]|uniref:Uncharacterized protein n=1 Tax=Panicum miliaceum TaxID=4540 RepID=A0A3L6THY4_PANMI|nr:hypothetical protein C2845_PM01G00430 [Panicum miliaceum]